MVLEALASGCRVVATDLPGVREVAQGISDEYVSLVRPPRLRQLDQPYPEDLPDFERRLARALDRQMAVALRQPQIEFKPIAAMLASHTWRGVFSRIEAVYFRLLGSGP